MTAAAATNSPTDEQEMVGAFRTWNKDQQEQQKATFSFGKKLAKRREEKRKQKK